MSKSQLLAWINEFLGLSYTNIEQTCSGIVGLQVMDAIHPGAVPLSKVNFNAKYEYEFAKNLKVLQGVFVKVGIEKEIEIDKLTKAKYQDNLEFMQWLKLYFDHNFKGDEYDAVGRRQQMASAAAAAKAERSKVADLSNTLTNENAAPNPMAPPPAKGPGTALRSQSVCHPSVAAPVHAVRLQTKVDALQKQMGEMKEVQGALEKQRDFYYGKLRNIEILLDDDAVLQADVGHLRATLQSILFNPSGDFVGLDDPDVPMEH